MALAGAYVRVMGHIWGQEGERAGGVSLAHVTTGFPEVVGSHENHKEPHSVF